MNCWMAISRHFRTNCVPASVPQIAATQRGVNGVFALLRPADLRIEMFDGYAGGRM